jgi:hypothetical protein
MSKTGALFAMLGTNVGGKFEAARRSANGKPATAVNAQIASGVVACRPVRGLTGWEPREIVQVALSEGLACMANRSTIQGSYPCVP